MSHIVITQASITVSQLQKIIDSQPRNSTIELFRDTNVTNDTSELNLLAKNITLKARNGVEFEEGVTIFGGSIIASKGSVLIWHRSFGTQLHAPNGAIRVGSGTIPVAKGSVGVLIGGYGSDGQESKIGIIEGGTVNITNAKGITGAPSWIKAGDHIHLTQVVKIDSATTTATINLNSCSMDRVKATEITATLCDIRAVDCRKLVLNCRGPQHDINFICNIGNSAGTGITISGNSKAALGRVHQAAGGGDIELDCPNAAISNVEFDGNVILNAVAAITQLTARRVNPSEHYLDHYATRHMCIRQLHTDMVIGRSAAKLLVPDKAFDNMPMATKVERLMLRQKPRIIVNNAKA
jgi:hypothetical protein